MNPIPPVYLVDDDLAVLGALKHLLKSAGYDPLCFASPNQFLEQYRPMQGGCLVLDMAMPGMNGLTLQTMLHEVDSRLPIIFLTGRGSIPTSVEAMKRGASDFLTKPVNDSLLLESISTALAHDRAKNAEDRLQKQARDRLAALTNREREVLHCVVKGMLNKEIAAALNISERTIKFHRAHLMQKFGVQHLAGLVMLVEQAGIGSMEFA